MPEKATQPQRQKQPAFIRSSEDTVHRLHQLRAEAMIATGKEIGSHDLAIQFLLNHWELTKRDSYGSAAFKRIPAKTSSR